MNCGSGVNAERNISNREFTKQYESRKINRDRNKSCLLDLVKDKNAHRKSNCAHFSLFPVVMELLPHNILHTKRRLSAIASLLILQKERGEVIPSPVGPAMVNAMYASPSSGPSP